MVFSQDDTRFLREKFYSCVRPSSFISAGTTSVSFYSLFVLICLTLAARERTDNALYGERLMDLVHVTSRVQIAPYRRPSSVAIACLPPPPTSRTIVSIRIRTVRARLFQEHKIRRKFQRAALRAQILTFNYCAKVDIHVASCFTKSFSKTYSTVLLI